MESRDFGKKCRVLFLLGLAAGAFACESQPLDATESGETDPSAGKPDSIAASYPIVFTSDRDSPGIGDLYVMSEDGASTRRISEGGDFWLPRWSPDGTRVLSRVVDGLSAEVGVLSIEGDGLVRLTSGEDPQGYYRPANWSADGTEVAFASLGDSTSTAAIQLWITADTGGQPELAFPDLDVPQIELAWSLPDGERWAYTMRGSSLTAGLWLGDTWSADGGVNLVAGRVQAPSFISWSPDGTRIAFSGFPLGPDGLVEGSGNHAGTGAMAPDDEIFVVDVDSGELTRLTDNAAFDFAPAWTPDGNGLIFSSNRDGDNDLWLVSLDAPEAARNLIDDDAAAHDDSLGHWYLGLR